MTSKERMIAAIRSEDVDHVPCCPTWWKGPPADQSFDMDDAGRIEFALDTLGIDTYLRFFPAPPHIGMRSWTDRSPSERYPLLHSVVDTPRGELHAIVRKTDDYNDDSVPFFSDFAASRYLKPWIETMDDVRKFESVYLPPSKEDIEGMRDLFSRTRELADRRQVLVAGYAGVTLDIAIWMMGAQAAALASVDQPEVINALVSFIGGINRTWLDMQLSWGVSAVYRRGWYDTTDFWSPKDFERWVVPELKEDTRMSHQAGAAVVYQACTGLKSLLPYLNDIDFDCLLEVEPVLGGIPLAELRRQLPGKSFWGGVSAPMHIGEGNPEVVGEAVRSAFEAVGDRGFIVKAVPSIRRHWPWENVMAMIGQWRVMTGVAAAG